MAEAHERTLLGIESGPLTVPPRGEGEAAADLVGRRLDHFEVRRLVGEGGMGAVYEAHDLSLDRRVALKTLRPELSNHPEHAERLLREARAQARLTHPAVTHIYYIGRQPGGPLFFAMEYVEGEPLEALVERGERLEPEVARRLMIQVAEGLRAAHRAGIVHRDIKPSNLLRSADGRVKIADFGLAKPIDADASITREGAVVGSPLYMAPEQARGEEVDHRADMYALGATFFHLLSGRPPYEAAHAMGVVARHLADPVPSLRERAPHVPPALAAIVERLLAKEPQDRFDDYDQLIEALREAAPGRIRFAGAGPRSAAVVLDLLFAGLVVAVLGAWGAFLHLAHVTLGHAYAERTVGKALLRLRVRRPEGGRLGLGRSLARTVGSLWMPMLAAATVALSQGFPELMEKLEKLDPRYMGELQGMLAAMAISHGVMTLAYLAGLSVVFFHPQKRALHDLVADSVVIYEPEAGAGEAA